MDTLLSTYPGLEGFRADIAERAVTPMTVIAGFNVLKHSRTHLVSQLYRQKWATKHFVPAGYSFGADVLPALYNRLPASDQQDVQAIVLLALARSGSFEIEVQGWLGKAGQEAPIAPELSRIPQQKLLCVYGVADKAISGCTLPEAREQNLQLAGGHHFDENYPALAARLISAIQARQVSVP